MKKRDIVKAKKSMEKVSQKSKKAAGVIPESLQVANPNAAGIDIGSEEHWVCVPADRVPEGQTNVRSFSCYTPDLYSIVFWLKTCDIDTVAMESTGVYWIPLYQLLEKEGFDVCLVNTKHLKNVKGRPKTDHLDCKWLMRLHSYGLLAASFRPADEICVLRSFMRWHETIVNESSDYIRRMSKALQQMNVRVDKAVVDITGATGLRIIEGIISGNHNPFKLAELRDRRCKKSVEEIAKALTGDYREEHIYVLGAAYEFYKFHQEKLAECEEKIEEQLKKLTPSKASLKKAYKKLVALTDGKIELENKPAGEIREALFPKFKDMKTYVLDLAGVDVTAIPGIDLKTVRTLISEAGLNLSSWETAGHFSAWLGLSPCANQSGTRNNMKQHTSKVQSRAAKAFRMAALAVTNSDTYLGVFYRRIKSRAGGSVAITATARKIAVIYYTMVKNGTEYKELGSDYRYGCPKRYIRKVEKNLRQYGYKLVPMSEEEKQKMEGKKQVA